MTDFAKKHALDRIKLFEQIIKLLERNNWSKNLLAKAEVSAGLECNYHYILFPEGHEQILAGLENWQDDIMIGELGKMPKPDSVRGKIAVAMELRIINSITKNAQINLNSALISNGCLTTGSKTAWRTCDVIWKYAGDDSTNFNYYTKRGLLLPIYLASRVFYLSDNSKDKDETKKFIKDGLDKIVNIAKLKSEIHLPKMEDLPILRMFN